MSDALYLAVLTSVGAAVKALQTRIRLNHLELTIREVRSIASAPVVLEPAAQHHQALLAGFEVPPGMVALGDFIEVLGDGGTTAVLRGFTDLGGTLFGWLGKSGPSLVPVMVLMSVTESDVYMTRMMPARAGSVAAPPFTHREDLPTSRTVAGVIAQHRERVTSAKGLLRVTTLGELQTELQRIRATTIAWRQTQSPGALLDKDLRSLLGARYDKLGARLAKRLAVEIPQARVIS